jgi:hypothetical protein
MGFPLLRQLPTPTELFVINLIPPHNPQPNAQLACRRHPRLAHSFLDQLAPIETLQLWVLDRSMQRRFRLQITQQRVALLGHLS